MTRRKFSAAPALVLILALLIAGAASASIINSVYQIGIAVSPQPNSGSFLISGMSIVDPNGNLQSIPSILPENKVFILTKVTYNFTATETNLNTPVTLNVGNYFRMGASLNSSFCAGNDSISPGIPIVNLGATVYLNRNSVPGTPIPGKLNLQLIGYIADIN